jgi:tRNA dihydrouridine synthase A
LESPVALQLGGSHPAELALAARVGQEFGYSEINLNCGCPSDRVQEGRFGACLMAEPARVAECVSAMIDAVRIPVTVKCRLGIDDQDPLRQVHRRRRLSDVHRPRPKGMAEGPVAAGEPRNPATQL